MTIRSIFARIRKGRSADEKLAELNERELQKEKLDKS
jgi:hypothetical protein